MPSSSCRVSSLCRLPSIQRTLSSSSPTIFNTLLKRPYPLVSATRLFHSSHTSSSCGPPPTSPPKHLSEEDKTKAIEKLSSQHDWNVSPTRAYMAKALEFKSFTNAFSFMTALALYSARKNHHPNIIQSYNRIYIQLNTHEREGPDKISREDINMARFIDKRIEDAVVLESKTMLDSSSNSLGLLMSLKSSEK